MKKRSNWFWNIVIFLTVVGCSIAFGLHYKNWVAIEEGHFKITSGIYSQKIPLANINSIEMVPKIPQMERKNGFSWLAKEKGVFLDSISGGKVYVFVDDLKQQKVRLVHQDSLTMYFNVTDSLETTDFFSQINSSLDKKE